MEFITYSRRKKTGKSSYVGNITAGSDDASVAKSVLIFISFGLTNGAESLAESYTPKSKAKEFIDVSLEMLGALKRGYENKFSNDAVVMCMKVNHQSKRIELTQLGRDVMLSLDNCALMISSTSLMQLYANIRNDMIKHPEIYGKDRQLTASSFPDPNGN